MLKVLKGLAEYLDLSLGELIEGIVLHAFDGKVIFGEPTKEVIEQLSTVYGLTLRAEDSHRLSERTAQDSEAGTLDLSGRESDLDLGIEHEVPDSSNWTSGHSRSAGCGLRYCAQPP
jgi:hypothetical protein